MNKNILIIKLMILLVSGSLINSCSSHTRHNISVQLVKDKIVIHNDRWAKDVLINGCDIDKSRLVPFAIDSTHSKLYVYSPCCYLKCLEINAGNIVDSIKVSCYGGEKNFEINTYNDFIVLSSSHRIWLFEKSKLSMFASLIDTIKEYTPIRHGNLYSFTPVIGKDSIKVDLMYMAYSNDSVNKYHVCFHKTSFSFPQNPDFYKIPKKNFVIPTIEDTVQ